MIKFNARAKTKAVINWIKDYMAKNGDENTTAVVGVSGGKDSTVVLKLCAEAVGPEKVVAVLMPQGYQDDIRYAYTACTVCGIPAENIYEINIEGICCEFLEALNSFADLEQCTEEKANRVITNYPARIRMSILYAVAAMRHGRVVNTCNLSEDWVGFMSKHGDSAGDFAPIANFTVTEVKEIGRVLGLPSALVDKTPIDGLCGQTDEENLGFTYAVLDKYIREGICPEPVKEIIDKKHYANIHKLKPMPKFYYRPDREEKRMQSRQEGSENESTSDV